MKLPFELFVAWRYLRERGARKGLVTVILGLVFLAAAVAMWWLSKRYEGLHPYELSDSQRMWKQGLEFGGLGALVLGILVAVFGIFHTIQSIFTTISTYGVFLGTAALVIVLSVMNGFEVDLRKKILGSNAHMLVTRDGTFTDWREAEAKLDGLCAGGSCVVAHTPYVTSEVVIAADSNYQPVVIKGIDPRTVGAVTDLERNVSQGSLQQIYPQAPDAGPASAPPDAGDDPPDFSGGGDAAAAAGDEEPIDFWGEPVAAAPHDAGPALLPPPRRPRALRPDPRTASLEGVLVGKELAKNLRLYEGEEVQVISPLGKDTPAGQVPRTRAFRVAGIFFTGMYEYDARIVYVSIPALQSFLGLGDEVTGIEIKVSDRDVTGPLVAAIKARLGEGYRVKDWQELNRSLFAALKLEQIAMFMVLTIIILVASFSIISNLIMVVVEKGREIAILKSMGASDWAIMRIFVAEGAYIGVLGTTFGLIVGLTGCWALETYGLPLNSDVYYIDRLPVALNPLAIVAVAIAGVLISIVATIYPAYVGARMRPVDGLKH